MVGWLIIVGFGLAMEIGYWANRIIYQLDRIESQLQRPLSPK